MSLQQSVLRPTWDDPLVTTLRTLTSTAGGLMVFASAAEGRVPASLINAGLVQHPASRRPCLAHVAFGNARRAARLAIAPQASLTTHHGRKWLTAEGMAQVIHGPWDERSADDDPALRLDEAGFAQLLRTIYREAGGGEHPDWEDYDHAMRRELRVVVLVEIERLYGIHWD